MAMLQLTLVFLAVASLADAEVFTAMVDLENVIYTESNMVQAIKNYVIGEEKKLNAIKQQVDRLENINREAVNDPEHYLGHPVNSFLMVKRFLWEWAEIESLVRLDKPKTEYLVNITQYREYMPDGDDLTGAASALLRLQDTYRLDTSTIASGQIEGTWTTPQLTAHECFEVGRVAYTAGDGFHCILWMKEALKRLDKEKEEDSGARRVEILDYLSWQIYLVWLIKPHKHSRTHECFELGRVAYNANDHYHTILWMKEAMKRQGSEENPQVDRATLLDYLAWAIYQEGEMKDALRYTKELLEIDPNHERAQNNMAFFEFHLKEKERKRRGDSGDADDADEKKKQDDFDQADTVRTEKAEEAKPEPERDENGDFKPSRPVGYLPERTAYEALCRGDEDFVKVFKNPRGMTCRYNHYNKPLLMLQPAKEETVFLKPKIILYRDIISEEEIRIVKGIASPRLNRATIQNSVTGNLEYADYRISKSAWLKEEEHEVIERIRNRVSAYTNLDLRTAEELQVVNYGIGGHYEPHFDFARRENAYEEGNRIATMLFYKEETNAFKSLGTGNRIATMLFYMSDVEAGGATVFPKVGARLLPMKGSAAFWFNLHPSGEGNYDTRHAGCPVLAGSKWVSNIWIHEQGQEFRRRCDLDEDKY